jgi:integrase
MRVLLTDRFCAGAKAAGAAQVDYFDEDTSGLALRVTSDGIKAWSLIFTSPKNGKRARMTLGRYPQTSLAGARTLVLEAKGQLEKGTDPRDALTAAGAAAVTVSGLIPLYLEKPHRRTGRPRKSVKEIERRFNLNVVPVIGAVKLADLHRRDVNRVIAPIMRRQKLTEAARVFEDLRGFLRWGVGQGYLDRNPAEGMEPPAAAQARDRTLADAEIRTLWNGLPKALARSVQCQRIIKLCLVTAQRVGEVAGMELSELNLKKAEWVIPGARSKNGHASGVPLSPLAIDLIKAALADAGKGATFVFPNPEGNDSLPAAAVARTILRAHEADKEHPRGRFGIEHFTAHDLRRTAVSQMAKLGVAPIVLGHVINHRSVTKAGVTLSVYSHYDYAREKAEALNLWAERLATIVGGRRG